MQRRNMAFMRAAIVAAVALVVGLAACVTGPHIVRQNSTAQIAPTERDRAFSRALATLQGGGWILAVSDRSAGLLTTQTMKTGVKPCENLTCDSRSTLQITIAETGAVTVNLHREFWASGFGGYGEWFVPTYEPDVLAIQEEQDKILAAIIAAPPTVQKAPAAVDAPVL